MNSRRHRRTVAVAAIEKLEDRVMLSGFTSSPEASTDFLSPNEKAYRYNIVDQESLDLSHVNALDQFFANSAALSTEPIKTRDSNTSATAQASVSLSGYINGQLQTFTVQTTTHVASGYMSGVNQQIDSRHAYSAVDIFIVGSGTGNISIKANLNSMNSESVRSYFGTETTTHTQFATSTITFMVMGNYKIHVQLVTATTQVKGMSSENLQGNGSLSTAESTIDVSSSWFHSTLLKQFLATTKISGKKIQSAISDTSLYGVGHFYGLHIKDAATHQQFSGVIGTKYLGKYINTDRLESGVAIILPGYATVSGLSRTMILGSKVGSIANTSIGISSATSFNSSRQFEDSQFPSGTLQDSQYVFSTLESWIDQLFAIRQR